MALRVVKFGGTSVADLEKIRRAAMVVRTLKQDGHNVIAVVSAMAGETERLVTMARAFSGSHNVQEYDTVVAAGEQASAGLLALALQESGVAARSWLGWQIPIHTDSKYTTARITHIAAERLLHCLEEGCVCVVAGFQGLAPGQRVSTLGRGRLGPKCGCVGSGIARREL